jgi:hypothetical protein
VELLQVREPEPFKRSTDLISQQGSPILRTSSCNVAAHPNTMAIGVGLAEFAAEMEILKRHILAGAPMRPARQS